MNDVMGKPYTLEQCAAAVAPLDERRSAAAPAHRAGAARALSPVGCRRAAGRAGRHRDRDRPEESARQAANPDLYSRLVGLFETGSTQAMAELEFGARRGRLRPAAAPSATNWPRAPPMSGALVFARQARNLEKSASSATRRARPTSVRRDARRPPRAHRRAVAALPLGERMSSDGPPSRSPSSPTMRISADCCSPKRPWPRVFRP